MNRQLKTSLKLVMAVGVIGTVAWVVAALPDFDPNNEPIGYVGQPAVSSHILYTGATASSDTRIYAIDYSSTTWAGNLHSYPLSTTGSLIKTDDWTNGAAGIIDGQNYISGRNIVTRNSTGTPVAFLWGSLSAAQKTALDSPNANAASSPVLNYIRGDRTNEAPSGLLYRARARVLGDIIHSTPLYCGAADCTAATLFVGANDGMLHAIDAGTGSERFAYIPSSLIPNLPLLLASSYTHKYFVDGRFDLMKFGSKTILAGALGSGGKGLFALDVTNAAPANETAAASKILWEITNTTAGFANLGYTYGQPRLGKLHDGTPALIVGNGYNNSSNGRASLFIINPDTGALIREISTSDSGTLTSRNGLSSPTLLDVDTDGNSEYAYAGDLDGNVWKFDLSAFTATKLYTVSPAQSITMAPVVVEHPNGGFMVTFVTGRMLVAADATDNATHYAYGIWDGAPVSNTTLATQTLTETTYSAVAPSIRVRTAAAAVANTPNWSAGGDKGWKTALPIGGERVVGDGAYVTGTVFLFMTTNPTITAEAPLSDGENWWMQLNALTGGDNGTIRFDLDNDGSFSSSDQVTVGGHLVSPVGRNMGGGRRSQLTAISAGTFVIYDSSYDKNITTPVSTDRGVSNGHFDYDIYYYQTAGSTFYTPTATSSTGSSPFCLATTSVNNELNGLSPTYCTAANGYPATYGYMSALSTGASCGGRFSGTNLQTITCNPYTTDTTPGSSYATKWHSHQYDDIYDVTGVHMVHPSLAAFKLSNAITNPSTPFKLLVMNQFLNPAAKLAVGPGFGEVSVKTYGNLANQTDATALLSGLTTYTPGNIQTLVFNLPKDAFQPKDWWGSGGDGGLRAGLIPTQPSCVNAPSQAGVANHPGPNGERDDGALTLQLIKANTPASALELNRAGDVRYGWRVKAAEFTNWVLAEYTAFWHHPNGKCYGDSGWVQNPPQDAVSSATPQTPDAGALDPKGVFGNPVGGTDGATIVSVVNNQDGSITTTYSNGTIIISYPDGSSKTTTSDGTVGWNVPGVDVGGAVDSSGGLNGPEGRRLITPADPLGRINWRELHR